MSQNLTYIRNELKGFCEIDSPFDIKKGEIIKFITLEKNEEFFYSGTYLKMIHNQIVVKIDNLDKYVILKIQNKDGGTLYKTRLFTKDEDDDECDICEKDKKEYEEIIKSQQKIIEKMSSQNINYKNIIETLHEKNLKYEGVIKKLINERNN